MSLCDHKGCPLVAIKKKAALRHFDWFHFLGPQRCAHLLYSLYDNNICRHGLHPTCRWTVATTSSWTQHLSFLLQTWLSLRLLCSEKSEEQHLTMSCLCIAVMRVALLNGAKLHLFFGRHCRLLISFIFRLAIKCFTLKEVWSNWR